eukprot:maker-scaffold195_size270011-snap-gene-1.16 protein:Tk11330 transcript:maker-scaffold195_size270011-snap-gene-1.16-mRNA-1 annotation:"hypothetical protein KGM_18218"
MALEWETYLEDELSVGLLEQVNYASHADERMLSTDPLTLRQAAMVAVPLSWGGETLVKATFLTLLLLVLLPQDNCSRADNSHPHKLRKRHTPFLPEDHWPGRPEFGSTITNVTVMVNGTADIRCPIGHIMDSSRFNKDIVVATLAHLLQKCDVQAAIEELELGPPTITKVDISPELDSDIATALANATLEAAAVADLEDEKVKRATTPPPSEVVLTVRGSASQAKKTICVSLWKGVECAHPATCNRTHLPLCTSVDCKPLSFVRRKDFHILSNGHTLFTNDPRIEIIHRAKTIDWILRIKEASFADAGNYDCQVSLKSGLHRLPFELHVVSPKAVIMGSSEFHLDRGSTLSLSCTVKQATTDTQFVFWYHGNRMINYDRNDRISVQTLSSKDKKQTNSTLIIRNADPSQSGNFTCQPSNALGASIQVFVSEDRHSEPLLRPDAKDSGKSSGLEYPMGNGGARGTASLFQVILALLWTLVRSLARMDPSLKSLAPSSNQDLPCLRDGLRHLPYYFCLTAVFVRRDFDVLASLHPCARIRPQLLQWPTLGKR